jgi:hypothetical protein
MVQKTKGDITMGIILGKSRPLVPRPMKEIRYIGHPERKATQMAHEIAKQFGIQSKKAKPKKIMVR